MIVDNIHLLPDDIIDKIYSKVLYTQPKNLLNEIIKYGENRENIYYLNKLDDDMLYECLNDFLVISLLFEENKTPYSCDPEQLSDTSTIKLEKILNNITYGEEFDISIAFKIIQNIIMNTDIYYTNNVLEPYISIIKNDEMMSLGYLTYNGV